MGSASRALCCFPGPPRTRAPLDGRMYIVFRVVARTKVGFVPPARTRARSSFHSERGSISIARRNRVSASFHSPRTSASRPRLKQAAATARSHAASQVGRASSHRPAPARARAAGHLAAPRVLEVLRLLLALALDTLRAGIGPDVGLTEVDPHRAVEERRGVLVVAQLLVGDAHVVEQGGVLEVLLEGLGPRVERAVPVALRRQADPDLGLGRNRHVDPADVLELGRRATQGEHQRQEEERCDLGSHESRLEWRGHSPGARPESPAGGPRSLVAVELEGCRARDPDHFAVPKPTSNEVSLHVMVGEGPRAVDRDRGRRRPAARPLSGLADVHAHEVADRTGLGIEAQGHGAIDPGTGEAPLVQASGVRGRGWRCHG